MTKKIFKSLEEQIEILQGKGLVINDINYCKEVLLHENYFFIMGYRHVFLKNDGSRKFIDNTTFEELYSLFMFDRKFRNIIFKNLLIVENNYKSIFSYVFSKKYGFKDKEYLSPNNFDNTDDKMPQINDLLRKIKRQLRVNGRHHQATNHYMENYGYIPLWIGIKVVSFGIMGELFCILKEEEKTDIANIYKVDKNRLEVYLPMLSNYRNLCAHEDILFDHFTQKNIPDSKYHQFLNIEKIDDEYNYGKSDIFALVIMLKEMLRDEDFKMMMNEINYELDKLNGKIKSIGIDKVLDKMGFPKNYKDIMYIERV